MCSSIHPIISTLLQDLKLIKHWFSSFQWVPLQEGMNEICATFRPPITLFLMAGALTHISHLSHWTALWEFKTAPLHRLHSALQFEQYQESLPDSIFCNSTGPRFTQDAWKLFSQSSHLTAFSAALQYYLHVRHWNLGPGFISISPAKIIRINKWGRND